MKEFLKKWIEASRPWTLTASIIPVLLGSVLAWYQGYNPNMYLFIPMLIAGMLLQIAANLLNTYGDYVSGIDNSDTKQTNRELIEGNISPQKIKNVALSCIALAAFLGIFLIYAGGIVILIFGILGILGTLGYTTGKHPYKYYALGTIFVFFLMGFFMVLPAYYLQSNEINLIAICTSLPISILVAGILFTNEIRDLETDKQGGIKTLAMLCGFERAVKIYIAMLYISFLCLILLVAIQALPITALLPFLTMPLLLKVQKQLKPPVQRLVLVGLVKFSAKFHFLFGFLMILGIAIGIFI